VQAYVFLVILLLSVHFETYWSLPRNCYSSNVKIFIVLASKTNNSEKDFHDPSKASFDVIRLAGTVRFEAFTAVSQGCCP
jgi:hypothetical protein